MVKQIELETAILADDNYDLGVCLALSNKWYLHWKESWKDRLWYEYCELVLRVNKLARHTFRDEQCDKLLLKQYSVMKVYKKILFKRIMRQIDMYALINKTLWTDYYKGEKGVY